MDSSQPNKLQFLALGGACTAVAVSLAYIGCGCRSKGEEEAPDVKAERRSTPPVTQRPAPQRPATTPKTAPKASSAKAGNTGKLLAPKLAACEAKNLDDLKPWAAGLKKRDAAELPVLLSSMEKLLKDQPKHEALPTCLKALAQLVLGHQEADRVTTIALTAGLLYPEQALEVLNNLFKDRRQRGGFVADPAVVDFALQILRNSLNGGVERATYQRACRLVDWLTCDAENRAELAARGGFETLLQVMETFSEDQGVLLEGCGCLQHLAEEPSLDVDRSIAIAVSTLKNQAQNPELQWRAMAVLHMFPLPQGEMRLSVAKMACAAAERYPRCDTPTTVVEWSGKLLHKLAKEKDSEVRAWLKDPAQKPWIDWFRELPHKARGKINPEAEHWSKELCRLCGTPS